MKYLIALALVTLAYADPIYYKTSGVAQLPAGARAASPFFLYKWAGANAAPATAATLGYPVAIAADDAMNLNAAAKVLALDQASIGAPSSYAPAMQALAPAAARVYAASALPILDAAARGFPAAVEAEDSLSAAAKALAIEQANFGAASMNAPYYKSVVAAAPSALASARLVAVTEFAPAPTRVFAPAAVGAAANQAVYALNPAAASTGFAPAASRVFAPAGAAASHAMHALGPAAYAPGATRFFAPASHPAGAAAAAAPSVYLSDSGVYKINHLSQIA